MDTLQTICELAATRFGGEPHAIDVDAAVDQLGMDSLDFLEFLFELEDCFCIPIPPESVTGVHTLRELAAAMDGLLAAKATPTT